MLTNLLRFSFCGKELYYIFIFTSLLRKKLQISCCFLILVNNWMFKEKKKLKQLKN